MNKANMKRDKKVDTRMRMRINHDAKIDVLVGDEIVLNGYLRDISQQGLYLSSVNVGRLGHASDTAVFVKLSMQCGQSSLAVEAKGLVVRIDPDGCAICFTHSLVWWPVFTVFPTRNRKEPETGSSKPHLFDNSSVNDQPVYHSSGSVAS